MELLFIMLFGVCVGLAARYALPWRAQHGSMLIPALGGIVSAIVWLALTWLGWAWDGGWIWVVTLAVTAIVCVAVDLVLGSSRNKADAATLRALGA
ncbi:hypothetical protein SAMN04489806_3134 [Paramicrobacterium humi]|uniref:Integral membrane protein n=1 Tax=Paramicrobacterium humi TaxID=640635 RepID=A0A1H4T8I2_9MICO|nr:hypothetical protein [Microbacterium humi]SEC52746.1 hypothetical protein SAMN04489806_3134 [Microbacterium humi]